MNLTMAHASVPTFAPSAAWWPLLRDGKVMLNEASNRLVWADSGRFAAALVPTRGVAAALSSPPPALAPVLERMGLISTAGALASVANLAISIVGLDSILDGVRGLGSKIDAVLEAFDRELELVRLTRLYVARENLEQSLRSSNARVRELLAWKARDMFHETRQRTLILWQQHQPWVNPTFAIADARELQARYIAAAAGQLQAEFLLDADLVTSTSRLVGRELQTDLALDIERAMAPRREAAERALGPEPAAMASPIFRHRRKTWRSESKRRTEELVATESELAELAAATRISSTRLLACKDHVELPALLGLSPLAAIQRLRHAEDVTEPDVLAFGELGSAASEVAPALAAPGDTLAVLDEERANRKDEDD